MMSRIGFVLALATVACGASSSSSGSSPGPNHPHSRNFVLTEGQTYVKNPDVKLRREYWIIVRSTDGTSAMLPRPDGDPRIVEECTTNGPLASLFANASLCQSATQGTLDRVNRLTTSEAMQTSTFLHSKLRFVADAMAGTGVAPFPLTDDLLDICKTFPEDRSGTLRSVCDEELKFENGGARPTIGRTYSADEAGVIAARLNEIYGIP